MDGKETPWGDAGQPSLSLWCVSLKRPIPAAVTGPVCGSLSGTAPIPHPSEGALGSQLCLNTNRSWQVAK